MPLFGVDARGAKLIILRGFCVKKCRRAKIRSPSQFGCPYLVDAPRGAPPHQAPPSAHYWFPLNPCTCCSSEMLAQEREAAYEREQERIRREKEAEVARLRQLQERALDEKAMKDALMAKRAAEENERKWRKKEAMDAIHKKETDLMLKQSRLKQIEDKQHYEGLQAQREKADFQRVLRLMVFRLTLSLLRQPATLPPPPPAYWRRY